MKTNLLLLACILTGFLYAQTTANFENFTLDTDTFLKGSDGNGGYSSGNIFLNNSYTATPTYDFWDGFAISNVVNITSAGFGNQYACISGSGYNNSSNYAVSYVSGEAIIRLENEAAGGGVEGFYINNSTYAYLSMRDGDGVAKQFGGVTGDDADFLFLTIGTFLNGARGTETVEFYLADYRFSDNTQDYLVNEWTYVDLTSLGNADSLSFTLTSSDVGQFGINTPTYFCMDDFTTKDAITGIQNVNNNVAITLYPNSVQDILQIDNQEKNAKEIVVSNSLGQIVMHGNLNFGLNALNLSSLNSGMYIVRILLEDGSTYTKHVIKD